MAFAPLILKESLRPWFAAGLTHLLLDSQLEDAPLAELSPDAATLPGQPDGAIAEGGACRAPAFARSFSSQPENARSAGNVHGTPRDAQAAAGGVAAGAFATGGAATGKTAGNRTPGVGAPAPATGQPGHAPVSLPDIAEWPGIWRRQFERAPERPVVVWTYWALGHDLCCVPDAGRRDRLREILRPLNLAKGSSAFLPCVLPSDDSASLSPERLASCEFVPDIPVFWAALRRLAPKVLVCFGMPALEAVWPGSGMRLYQQATHRGVQVVALPDLLAPESPDAPLPAVGPVAAYLAAVLTDLLSINRELR